MPIFSMVRWMMEAASLSACPGLRLKEMVFETNRPWWLTASAVLPGSNRLKALSGTIFSTRVLTGEPPEAAVRPVVPMALMAWLRAASAAIAAAVVADGALTPELTTPAGRLVGCVAPAVTGAVRAKIALHEAGRVHERRE